MSGHKALLEHNPTLARLIHMRNPYIDPINIMQVGQLVVGRSVGWKVVVVGLGLDVLGLWLTWLVDWLLDVASWGGGGGQAVVGHGAWLAVSAVQCTPPHSSSSSCSLCPPLIAPRICCLSIQLCCLTAALFPQPMPRQTPMQPIPPPHTPSLTRQVEVLRRLRADPGNQKLRDALLVSINGIAAGMRNTG